MNMQGNSESQEFEVNYCLEKKGVTLNKPSSNINTRQLSYLVSKFKPLNRGLKYMSKIQIVGASDADLFLSSFYFVL